MNNSDIRNIYLKKLYYRAGKNLNDELKRYAVHFINYTCLNNLIALLCNSKNIKKYILADRFAAFFDIMCRKVMDEINNNDIVLIVFDPHFSEQTICQVYFTDINLTIINNIKAEPACEADRLYSKNCYEKTEKINKIALEFFKTAYKNN